MSCKDCSEITYMRGRTLLCEWCEGEPVVGLESSSDPALAAVYRGGNTPLSLSVTVDVANGRCTVCELVP